MANNIDPNDLFFALGATPAGLSPTSEAAFITTRQTLLGVVSQLNLLQQQQQQQQLQVPPPAPHQVVPPQVVPPHVGPLRPRVGGVIGVGIQSIAWTGGGALPPNVITDPESAKAYRSSDLSIKMKTEKACTAGLPESRRLPIPGSMDTKDLSSIVSLTDWIRGISTSLKECGMDGVFRALIAPGTEIYLLEKWGQATKDVVDAHVLRLRTPTIGDVYDIDNLAMSGKFLLNSLDDEMLKRTEQELGQTLTTSVSGPDVFRAVIALHSMLNDSTERQFIEKLRNMKLKDEPGEDVNTFSNKVLALANHITGLSDTGVSDLHTLVYTAFDGASTPTFATAVSNTLSNCYLKAATPRLHDWEYQVVAWKAMYRDLKSRDEWVALKNVKETGEAQGLVGAQMKALAAEIQKLTRIVGTQGAATGHQTITCYICGEPGHKAPQCPHKDAQGGTRGSTGRPSGLQVKKAPSDGEPHTKLFQNAQYKWCSVCKKWNTGTKAHLTEEHVKRQAPAGQMGQEAPEPDPEPDNGTVAGTLSRVSGYLTTIPRPIVPIKPVMTRTTHFITGITPHGPWAIEDDDGCPSNLRGAISCRTCMQYSTDPNHQYTKVHAYNLYIAMEHEANQTTASLQALSQPSRIGGFIGSITNIITEEEMKAKEKEDDLAQ